MINCTELTQLQEKQASLLQRKRPTSVIWKHVENGVWARVGKRAGVSLVFRYQYHGRAQALTLGKFPALTLDEVQSLATLCRGWLNEDKNPSEMLPEQLRYAKVFKLVGEFTLRICIAEHWKQHTRSANPQRIISAAEKYLFPRLGDRRIDDITPPEWLMVFRDAADAAPEMAKKLLITCKSAVGVARASGLCTSRALDDIKPKLVGIRSKPRQRVLSDTEIIALMEWINSSNDAYFSTMARLLIMLGCRTGEVRQAHCTEFEFEISEDASAYIWRVPPEHSKSGVEIVRQLSSVVTPFISGLLRAAEQTGSPYLLGEPIRSEYTASSFMSELGRSLSDGDISWTAHDLRRTVATRMADLGVEPWVIEHSVLAHSIPGVAGMYNRAKQRAACSAAYELWHRDLQRLERKNQFKLIEKTGERT